MKKYNASPLPFQGQKRNFLKHFREVLKEYPDDAIYVDLFGGSGLLSHTIKSEKPNARVIWNDYDNFQKRLELIPVTNEILKQIRLLGNKIEKKKYINQNIKIQILEILRQYTEEQIDFITFSACLLFSGQRVFSLKEFERTPFYNNNLKKLDYNADGYLQGVERVEKDYKELITEFTNIDNVVFIIDPPYLFTDVKSYNGVVDWKLKDYLAIVKELIAMNKYVYFGSNKGQLLDLFDFLANEYQIQNPFDRAKKVSSSVGVGKGNIYEDLMIYKY